MLNVPLIIQPKNSRDCGIAGIAMLLKYYGKKTSFKEIKKDIPTDKVGTYAPQLGSYLIRKNFNVEIVTMHPALFTKKDKIMSQKEILARFKAMHKKSTSAQNKKVLKYFIEFMELGGKIKVKIPSKEDITKEIKQKRPVCAVLTSNFLNGSKAGFNFHLNLVTGIDNKYVYVNDPLPDNRGGKNKHSISDFLYGIYASAHADLDNACLIKVRN